jgi:hypothetical protein
MRIRSALIVVLLASATAAQAQQYYPLGTSHYWDAETTRTYAMTVLQQQDGSVALLTNGPTYVLSGDEVAQFRNTLSAGLRLIGIAQSNQTFVTYVADLGQQVMTDGPGTLQVWFQTAGWPNSFLTLMFVDSGSNALITLDHAQASELLAALDRTAPIFAEQERQLALFAR